MYEDMPTRRLEEGLPKLNMYVPRKPVAKVRQQPAKTKAVKAPKAWEKKKAIIREAKAQAREIIRQAKERAAEIELAAAQRAAKEETVFIERRPVKAIILEVAAPFGLSYSDIVGASRSQRVVEARHAAICAAHISRPDLSLPQLGRVFNRDHTTILHALRRGGARKGEA